MKSKQKNNSSKKWLDFSWEDLRIIDDLIREEAYGLACFHSQQSVEKALKAYLVKKEGKSNKLHSLTELIELCKKLDNSFENFEDHALIMDRYYIPVRYPDALPGSLPEGMPSNEDAKEALKMAGEIFEFIKNKLNIKPNHCPNHNSDNRSLNRSDYLYLHRVSKGYGNGKDGRRDESTSTTSN